MPSTTSKNNGEPYKPLRQLAVEKTHGEGANPTLLGDPISLATEETTDDNGDGGKTSATTADSTSKGNAEANKRASTSDDNQTKRHPIDHDNEPSDASGSVTKRRAASKL